MAAQKIWTQTRERLDVDLFPHVPYFGNYSLNNLYNLYHCRWNICKNCTLFRVWEIVQRAGAERAAAARGELFLWVAGAGRALQDAAGGADGGCLCGPQRSVLCRALLRLLEVLGVSLALAFYFFNECFMLNWVPPLFKALFNSLTISSMVKWWILISKKKRKEIIHQKKTCSLKFFVFCHQNNF